MKKKDKPIVVRRRRADADKLVKPMTEELRRKLKVYAREARREAALSLGNLVLSEGYQLVAPMDDPSPTVATEDDDLNWDGVVQAAMQLAEERTAQLLELRAALQASDTATALRLAAQLTGLQEAQDEARNSASPRVH